MYLFGRFNNRIAGILFTLLFVPAAQAEWSGNIGLEMRGFAESAPAPQDYQFNSSVYFQPEWYQALGDNAQLGFEGFARWDQHDDERSHLDLREFYWRYFTDEWELLLGVNKVFWGVAETVHLVDIVNQTDLVENLDREDKLGQPMIQLSWLQNWGVLDVFVLPGFRERTFPGIDGRPQVAPLVVNTDRPIYESGAEEQHIDFALRWSHTVNIWDIGLSHFIGTSRDPRFIPDFSNPQQPVLLPWYEQIQQTGLDIQATMGAWLLKWESFYRRGQGDSITALVGGLEYTLFSIFNSASDMGIVAEYIYDERELELFDNDLALGLRFTLNDFQSTSILIAVVSDLDDQGISYFLEASRRLGKQFKLDIELRGAADQGDDIILQQLEQDRYLQLELGYYF